MHSTNLPVGTAQVATLGQAVDQERMDAHPGFGIGPTNMKINLVRTQMK